MSEESKESETATKGGKTEIEKTLENLLARGLPPRPCASNPGRLMRMLLEFQKESAQRGDEATVMDCLVFLVGVLDLDHWASECAAYQRLQAAIGPQPR